MVRLPSKPDTPTTEHMMEFEPKPAEQWSIAERFSALDQLGMYDYVPFSPESIQHGEIHGSVEKRSLWFWTVEGSMTAVASAWPASADDKTD